MRKILPYIALVPMLLSGCTSQNTPDTTHQNAAVVAQESENSIDYAYLQSIMPEQPSTLEISCSRAKLKKKKVYEPRSCDAVALFIEASKMAGIPQNWAYSPALHEILDRESEGMVGVPNYTIKTRLGKTARFKPRSWKTIKSQIKSGIRKPNTKFTGTSAMGLGQLTKDNMNKYSLNGFSDIGNPLLEASAMLLFIQDRYNTPESALDHHEKKGWY